MKERPIIFSGPMVRAILEGRKTQTRRLATPLDFGASEWSQLPQDFAAAWTRHARPRHPRFGEKGDRLWTRETHAQFAVGDGSGTAPQCVAYRATCDEDGSFSYRGAMRLKVTKWTPSIYMPRWASRLILEIAEVRVQHLQDISDEDAKAEGIRELPLQEGHPGAWWTADVAAGGPGHARTPIDAYRKLWDSINGAGAPWSSNPWVWVIGFRRVERVKSADALAQKGSDR